MAIASIFLALLGLCLFVRGWIGRRIGDEPRCRRCNFDLRGQPADSPKCPECGADLAAGKSTVTGQRHRHRALLYGSAVVLILSLLLGVAPTLRTIRTIDWPRHFPVSWLLTDTRSTGAGRAIAMKELLRRATSNELSQSKATAVMDAALAEQANPTGRFDQQWWAIVTALGQNSRIARPQQERLLRQTVILKLTARPTIRIKRYTSIRFGLDYGLIQWHPNQINGKVLAKLFLETAELESKLMSDESTTGQGLHGYTVGTTTEVTQQHADQAGGIGQRHLKVVVDCELSLDKPFRIEPVKFSKEITIPVRLAGHDEVVDEFVKDPALRPQMEAAFKEVLLDIVEKQVETTRPPEDRVWAAFRTDQLPLPIAADVLLRRGAVQKHVGTILMDHTSEHYWHTMHPGYPPPFTDGVADIILRPSQAIAELQDRQTRYCGEELVFKNIPVRATRQWFTHDESLRPAVTKSLEAAVRSEDPQHKKLDVTIWARGTPISLSYDVFLRTPDAREIRVHTVQFLKGANRGHGTSAPNPVPNHKTIDVILRPTADRTSHPATQPLPWDGTIEFKDVPIK